LSLFLKDTYDFDMGFINIAVNGGLTFLGLILIKRKK